jgi:ribosomal protein S18 acetylase RimI-like enzyme
VPVRYEPFARDHLDAILGLCTTQGWPSLPADPARAQQALNAPGVTTLVALTADEVVGFATVLSDGVLDAYLSSLLVAEPHRGTGLGDELLRRAYHQSGAVRVDLLAAEGTDGFYARFPHRRFSGFRLHPDDRP